ncbi:MAG: hypothetical protein M1836_008162 [Candelina mexicana]|nr:MAG: hypothetical protein M1836_008162 [Candelina mexicana]
MQVPEIEPILSDEALEVLTSLGFQTTLENGWRTIPIASYMHESPLNEGATIKVPDNLESRQYFEFLGFTEEESQTLWDRYEACYDECYQLANTHQMATYRLRYRANAYHDRADEEGSDWEGAMKSMGLAETLRSRIMTPGFENIRLTKNVRAWAMKSIKERMYFLRCLNSRILDRGELDIPRISTETAVSAQDDEILLFKGGNMEYLKKIMHEPEREFGIYHLCNKNHSDYQRGNSYGHVEDEQAAGILTVAVPKDLLPRIVQFHGQDFKDFAWYNKLNERTPEHLRQYKEAKVLVGPIIGCCNKVVKNSVWDETGPEGLPVLKVRDETAYQTLIQDDDLLQEMDDRCRVSITPYFPSQA